MPTIRTSPTRLLIFTLLAGFAVVGWAMIGAEREDWDEIAHEIEGEGGAPVEEVLADPLALPEVGASAADPLRGRIEVADGRGAPTLPQPAHIDPSLGFPVRVVMKDTKQPVPGASVFYYDTLSPRYRTFRSLRRQYLVDKELALGRGGERVVAGRDGRAVLPHGIPTQEIVARSGPYYGQLWVSGKHDPPEGGFVLEVERDRTLRVRVVDEQGRPVPGVRLAFYIGKRDGTGTLRWELQRDEDRDARSADGIQDLAHVQCFVGMLRQLSGGEPLVHLGLDIPGMTRCGPTVSIDDVPDEVVDLVMGPVGRVVVQVVDQDGAPVSRRVRLSTKPDFDYPDLAGDPAKLERYRPKWEVATDDKGLAVFERVGLLTGLSIESVGEEVGDGERARVRGPANPGEVVEVRLVKPFTAAWIEGVALDDRGAELQRVELRYAAGLQRGTADTGYLASGSAHTDEAGRFRIRLAPTREIPGEKGAVVEANRYRSLRLGLTGGGTLHAGVEVDLPQRLEATRYDVGRVRLRLPPLIASGRVYVDDEPSRFFDGFVLDFRNPDANNRWERVKDVAVHGKPGGHFEVRGELGDRALRLRPRAYGFLPVEPVMLSAGQHGIDIRLYTGGTLRLAVLYDAATADADMEVMLRPITIDYPAADPAIAWHFVGRVDKRSSGNLSFRRVYYWSGLPPGRYRIDLRLLGQVEPFAVLEQLEPVFRRRLEEIEPEVINLRGAIQRVRVRAVDGKGRPVSGLAIPLGQTAIETHEGVSLSGADGAVLHTTRREGIDVQVVARGYRTETAYGVTGERVVRMRPGIPITVDLTSLQVPKGVKLQVTLRRRSYDFGRLYRSSLRHPVVGRSGGRPLTILVGEGDVRMTYRGRRRFKATVMEHGDFTLGIELSREGAVPVRLGGYAPYRLTVRDTATEQEFRIAVNRRRLEQALRELGVEPGPSRKAPRGSGGKSKSGSRSGSKSGSKGK